MKQDKFMGADCVVLENDDVRAVILPAHGGKAVSLVLKENGFECLFQNPKPAFSRARRGDNFSDFEACGFDDAFPTVDACEVSVGGRTVVYPDHGEIWSAAFETVREGDALKLRYESDSLGYVYEKTWSVEGHSLVCTYRIHNPGSSDIPAIWTCHCLMRAEAGMHLIVPEGADSVENVFSNDWLGEAGRILAYPLADGPRGAVDLSKMPSDGQLKYYFVSPVKDGCCGYRYEASGVEVTLHYDAKRLPYLGFWATGGAYRGDRNCALEPSDGYFDGISLATSKGRCPVLHAGETREFKLELRVDRFR